MSLNALNQLRIEFQTLKPMEQVIYFEFKTNSNGNSKTLNSTRLNVFRFKFLLWNTEIKGIVRSNKEAENCVAGVYQGIVVVRAHSTRTIWNFVLNGEHNQKMCLQ